MAGSTPIAVGGDDGYDPLCCNRVGLHLKAGSKIPVVVAQKNIHSLRSEDHHGRYNSGPPFDGPQGEATVIPFELRNPQKNSNLNDILSGLPGFSFGLSCFPYLPGDYTSYGSALQFRTKEATSRYSDN